MKLSKLMHQYYEDQLKSLKKIDPPFIQQKSQFHSNVKKHFIPWDDVLGIIVTATYILQLFIPTTWFSLGRCLSIFTLGF